MSVLSPRSREYVVDNTLGAFVSGGNVHQAPRGAGPLSGLTFAAKDLFDVSGVITGCGNPDWAATHGPAEADAWAIDAMLRAGAKLVGKTVTAPFKDLTDLRRA